MALRVNGRTLNWTAGRAPRVAICVSGLGPEPVDAGLEADLLPTFKYFRNSGSYGMASAVIPTLTSTNNASIVTGVSSAEHGVVANNSYTTSGGEVGVASAAAIVGDTLLQKLSSVCKVAVVTVDERTRQLVSKGLDASNSISLSLEEADTKHQLFGSPDKAITATELVGGHVDHADGRTCSVAAIRAAATLVKEHGAEFTYVATTDSPYHQFHHTSGESLEYTAKIDRAIASVINTGAVVGVVGDHGMTDKVTYSGAPRITYLESELQSAGYDAVAVTLPLSLGTTVHKRLGSIATVALSDKTQIEQAARYLRSVPGCRTVLNAPTAAAMFNMPEAGCGDILVIGDVDTALGRRVDDTDLSALQRLRTHGGLDEAVVPMAFSKKVTCEWSRKLTTGSCYNMDMIEFMLNAIDD